MSDGISDGQAYRAGASLEGKSPRRQLQEAGSSGTMNIPESTLIALADESLGFTDQGTPEHIAVREMARELLAHRANTHLAKAEQALADKDRVLQIAANHVMELAEAWQRGVIRECDGNGGERSNRNWEVVKEIRLALANQESE